MTNPTYDTVAVGDQFTSDISTAGGRGWFYISTVLAVDPVSQRFGKDDRIVRVRVQTNDGTVVDNSKLMWVSQLRQGLV
jgi:predicted HAD superfamily phosphohydrolase YqeG